MRKNIIILVPTLGIGGQERQAILLAEQLCKRADCRIVVFSDVNPCYHTEVKVLNLQLPSFQSKLGKFIQQFRRGAKLIWLRKREHIDLVISFGDTANLTNVLSGIHGESIVSLRSSWAAEYSAVKKFIYRKSDKILCQTKAMKEILLKNYQNIERKTSIFYNIFDVDDIEKKGCESCDLEQESDLKIITVGRLDKLKCYHHLIRAFSNISRIHEKVKLIIVGDGDEYNSLKNLALNLGIIEKIVFVGVVSNPYKYMKNADIFVLSSCVEGFPNVLLEAMICGLPVIATDCETGPREILSSTSQKANITTEIEYSDYGILVPAFQADDIQEPEKDEMLAQAMLTLIENCEKRKYYAAAAQKRTHEFSISHIEGKIQSLFIDM
ncbi:MAG: glycosyltransferase [Lachnospiraceae bacterium]|nr:glycosyltransferase [Lachnospiraceae bacterium]